MKVIGTTSTGLLIDASKDEVANLFGHNGTSNAPSVCFYVGTEIKVADAWKKLRYLSENKVILQATADKLRETANHLDVLNPVIDDALSENPKLQPQVRAIRFDE